MVKTLKKAFSIFIIFNMFMMLGGIEQNPYVLKAAPITVDTKEYINWNSPIGWLSLGHIKDSNNYDVYCLEDELGYPKSYISYQVMNTEVNQGLWALMEAGQNYGYSYTDIQMMVYAYIARQSGKSTVFNLGNTKLYVSELMKKEASWLVLFGERNNFWQEIILSTNQGVFSKTNNLWQSNPISVTGFVGTFKINGLKQGYNVRDVNSNLLLNPNQVPVGTQFVVETTETPDSSLNLEVTANEAYNYQGVYYSTTAAFQNVGRPGKRTALPKQSIQFTQFEDPGYVTVTKIEDPSSSMYSHKVLAGAHYQVKSSDGSINQIYTTNEEGQFKIYGPFEGKLTIQEIEAPQGYAIDTNLYTFNVSTFDYSHVELTNKAIEGTIKINKVNQEGVALEGASYQLLKDDIVIQSGETNANGELLFENVRYGDYYIQEIKAPVGYQLDTNRYLVLISQEGEVFQKTLENKVIEAQIRLKKVDGETNEPLKNVKFEILDHEGNVVGLKYNVNQSTLIENEWITDDQGTFTTKGLLPYGQYYLKETPLFGYIKPDLIPFKVDEHTIGNDQVVDLGIINNYREKGKIVITKTDETTHMPLPNVHYKLYDDSNTLVKEGKTNQDGVLEFNDLPYLTYYIVETQTIEPYVIDGEVKEVHLVAPVFNMDLTNHQAQGQITITKKGDDDLLLQNVEFEIRDSQGVLVELLVSNQEGQASSRKLPLGIYKVKETKTVEGYQIDNTEYEVHLEYIDQNTELDIKHLDIINKKNLQEENKEVKEGIVSVVKLDNTDETYLESAFFEVLDEKDVVVARLITNEYGYAQTENLPFGIYHIKEVYAPFGYMLDPATQIVELTEENPITESLFYNQPHLREVEVIKENETHQKLAGAVIGLYDSEGHLYQTITTDENGYGLFTEVSCKNTQYYLKEVVAPEGYRLSQTEYPVYPCQDLLPIPIAGYSVMPRQQVIINEQIQSTVSFRKLDKDTNLPISGVQFKLKDSEGKEVRQEQLIDGVIQYKDTWVSDLDGYVYIDQPLTYGRYYIEEQVLEGYQPIDSIPFDIKEDVEHIELPPIYNEKVKGKLTIQKVDYDTNEPIANVVYQILNQDMTEIATMSTNDLGVIEISGLEYGTYTIKEIEATKPYILDPTTHVIEINQESVIKVVSNQKAQGLIHIYKVNEEGQPLSGVEFDLIKDGIKTHVVTDQNGYATTSLLELGDYQVIETATNKGYMLLEEPLTLTIEYVDGLTPVVDVYVEITNYKDTNQGVDQKETPEDNKPKEETNNQTEQIITPTETTKILPKTGQSHYLGFMILLFGLIIFVKNE